MNQVLMWGGAWIALQHFLGRQLHVAHLHHGYVLLVQIFDHMQLHVQGQGTGAQWCCGKQQPTPC